MCYKRGPHGPWAIFDYYGTVSHMYLSLQKRFLVPENTSSFETSQQLLLITILTFAPAPVPASCTTASTFAPAPMSASVDKSKMQSLHPRLPSRSTTPSHLESPRSTTPSHLESSSVALQTASSKSIPPSSQSPSTMSSPISTPQSSPSPPTTLSSTSTPASTPSSTMSITPFSSNPTVSAVLQLTNPGSVSQYVLFTFHADGGDVTIRQYLLAMCSKFYRRTHPVEQQDQRELTVTSWPFAVVAGYVAFVDSNHPPGTPAGPHAESEFLLLASIYVFAVQMEDLATQCAVMEVIIRTATVSQSDGLTRIPSYNVVNIVYNGTQAPNALRSWLATLYVHFERMKGEFDQADFHVQFWSLYVQRRDLSMEERHSPQWLKGRLMDVRYWQWRRGQEEQ
jgi:hypothetical protein